MNESRLRRLRDRTNGAATLINQGCRITGVISGSGNYLVSGEIAGDSDVQGTITLSVDGHWEGTLRAESVIISGRMEGDIFASGKVEITATARISGNVTAEAIAVAEGAVVEGVMQTTGQSKPVKFVEKRSQDD
ncbi:MAG: polymer-forming cytoskeletal protein [Gammaproteobacteria bacterium]|nr:polymer-forming cytoskeletal protein [Gammaproteobacteria bacterium]MBU2677593.1 polymer-forming cytoskeletal protein [Gammaproteobacteria bacterium]NNL51325.1 polymer-forming cytoskeletal protein [Woeseiaceae bacterium]